MSDGFYQDPSVDEVHDDRYHFCEICKGLANHKTSRHPWPSRSEATDEAADTMHRKFGLCAACGLDVACWEGRDKWWHLDKDIHHDHVAVPPAATDEVPPLKPDYDLMARPYVKCRRAEQEVCTHPYCQKQDDEERAASSPPTAPDLECLRCGGPNVAWAAASPLWNLVMREGSINGPWKYKELVCIRCFIALAEEAGVTGVWRLTVTPEPGGMESATPSGRVWNRETWLWDEPTKE